MSSVVARSRIRHALAGAACAALSSAVAAAPAANPQAPEVAAGPLSWERAFPIDAAPADVHFRAHYTDGRGARHVLEVWRAGETYLHRRTDSKIDLYAVADASGGETRYRLLDGLREIAADVSRTNLHRIGVYADAFGLGHVVDPPKEPYRIETAVAPKGTAAGACEWKALVRTQSRPLRTLVCWSAQWGLPMAIVDGDGAATEVFRIDAVDQGSDNMATGSAVSLPAVPAGYALVDVNEEIDPAAD